MGNEFGGAKLPPIYQREGRESYLDPIRQKLIFITPEETVRQKVISYLMETLHVPAHMIRVEEHLSHYGLQSTRRADIIIEKYNQETNEVNPLAVIECKAPEVFLGEGAIKQTVGYADALLCDFCMMTNGAETFCFYYDPEKDRYIQAESLPDYVSMVKGEYVEAPQTEQVPRLTFEEIPAHCREYDNVNIGENTPDHLAAVCVNFLEGLLYTEHKFPAKQYRLFRVIEDYGVRLLSYGNASGGDFSGEYRSFLIEHKGSTEFVSIGMSPYCTWSRQDVLKTAVNVAIDREKTAHHSLQLVVDDNVGVVGKRVTFYHHGRIGVSNLGSGKIDELRRFVAREYPHILDGRRFRLGSLTNDRLWELDDPEVMEVVENLISYALIRDEYRDFLKNK